VQRMVGDWEAREASSSRGGARWDDSQASGSHRRDLAPKIGPERQATLSLQPPVLEIGRALLAEAGCLKGVNWGARLWGLKFDGPGPWEPWICSHGQTGGRGVV
jgi:hypothetical protein